MRQGLTRGTRIRVISGSRQGMGTRFWTKGTSRRVDGRLRTWAITWDGLSGTANSFLGEDYGTDWEYVVKSSVINLDVKSKI